MGGADTRAGAPGLGSAVKGWSAAWERDGNIRELLVPAAGRGPGTGDTTEIQPKARSLDWREGWELPWLEDGLEGGRKGPAGG